MKHAKSIFVENANYPDYKFTDVLYQQTERILTVKEKNGHITIIPLYKHPLKIKIEPWR